MESSVPESCERVIQPVAYTESSSTPFARKGKATSRKNKKRRFKLSMPRKRKSESSNGPQRADGIAVHVARYLKSEEQRIMYKMARKAAHVAITSRKCRDSHEAKRQLRSLHSFFSHKESQFRTGPDGNRTALLENILWDCCRLMGINYQNGTAMQQIDLLDAEINHCRDA